MNEILNKLKVDFQYLTGFVYKGMIASIGAGFASRLAEFASKLSFIERNAFISTADKEYLYLQTGNLLPPNGAETAEGYAVFYGDSGAIIPKATQLKDDKGTFVTLAEATISTTTLSGNITVEDGIATLIYPSHEITNCSGTANGAYVDITVIDANTIQFTAGSLVDGEAVIVKTKNTATVPIVSEDSGEVGNRNLNDVLKLKITIDGVDKEVGVILVSGGKDEEDVESYRVRVQDFIRNPQSPFNDNNIKYVTKKSVSTLKYVWVESPIEGEVQVVALNENYGLTTGEADAIKIAVKAIAPAQMDTTVISAVLPTVQSVQVVIADLYPASEGLQNEVEKNIRYIYETDMYEKGISSSLLEATIYKTTSGAEKVESFTLVSGSTVATDNTFFKYTGTTFE